MRATFWHRVNESLEARSRPLTQAGFMASQEAINKALWALGDVLGLSVPL